MSAGSGITHSEYNYGNSITTLFQIWIQPNRLNIFPHWEKVNLKAQNQDGLTPFASGEEKYEKSGILKINQDATLYVLRGAVDSTYTYALGVNRFIYLVLSEGDILLNGDQIGHRDGVYIQNEANIEIRMIQNSELLILDMTSSPEIL